LLNEIGVKTCFIGNKIKIQPGVISQEPGAKSITVESDWSSASYFYSIIALASEGTSVILSSYKQNSLQGDSALAGIYSKLGVDTIYSNDTVTLRKRKCLPESLHLDLKDTPDIAQTIAVTCFGLSIPCELMGLHTLKIKETDRLIALKKELEKLGATVSITSDSLSLKASVSINEGISIETYNDHRMAMAFAPLATLMKATIENPEVTRKSYPNYWNDLKAVGMEFNRS